MAALRALVTALLLMTAAWTSHAADFTGHVYDMTHHVLSAASREALDEQLDRLERRKGLRVVVALISNQLVPPDRMPDFARLLARQYEAEGPKALLILIIPDGPALRVEGEGASDALAQSIASEHLQPALTRGDFEGGSLVAVAAVVARVHGEKLSDYTTDAISLSELWDDALPDLSALEWWRLIAHTIFLGVYPGALLAWPLSSIARALVPAKWRGSPWITALPCVALSLLAFLFAYFVWIENAEVPLLRVVAGCLTMALVSWRITIHDLNSPDRGGSGSGSGSSYGDSGSSSSGGYSSGGGGDFGGGGASGRW